jgi:nicotinamidase-related amidase
VTAPVLDPARTALLVMDYQVGVVGRIADADGLLDRAAGAIALVRRAEGTVGHVRVAFTDADLAAVPPTNKSFARVAGGGAGMDADSPLTQVHERVAPQGGDVVVRKTRVGAFSTTDLDDRLRGRGVDTLLIAGISTSGVVLSTVRDAADRDYRLVVVSDLCADPDAEVHALLVDRVFPRQADVVASSALAGMLGAA